MTAKIIEVAMDMGWKADSDYGTDCIVSPRENYYLTDDPEAHKLLMLEIQGKMGWGIIPANSGETANCIATEWNLMTFDELTGGDIDWIKKYIAFADLPLAVIAAYHERMGKCGL